MLPKLINRFDVVSRRVFISILSLLSAEVKKQVPSVEEGEVLRPLMKCYTALEVSSNKGDVSRYSIIFCDLYLCS